MIEARKQKGKAWAVVCRMKGGEVVHRVETIPARIDRVISGMLMNMNREDYFIDEWYEFPFAGQKNKKGQEWNTKT